MAYWIAWTCAEYVRSQLERAYFLDLLDDGEDAPEVFVVGGVNLDSPKRRREAQLIWSRARA
jgi:hypothetical protein